MKVLKNIKWENFEKVIDKAKNSCKDNNMLVYYHFADIGKMVSIGLGAKRKQKDY